MVKTASWLGIVFMCLLTLGLPWASYGYVPPALPASSIYTMEEVFEGVWEATGSTLPAVVKGGSGVVAGVSARIPYVGLAIMLAGAGYWVWDNWDKLTALPAYFSGQGYSKSSTRGQFQAIAGYSPVPGSQLATDWGVATTLGNCPAGNPGGCDYRLADTALDATAMAQSAWGQSTSCYGLPNGSWSTSIQCSTGTDPHSPSPEWRDVFIPKAGYASQLQISGYSAVSSAQVQQKFLDQMNAAAGNNATAAAAMKELVDAISANIHGTTLHGETSPIQSAIASDITLPQGAAVPGTSPNLGNLYTYYYMNYAPSNVQNTFNTPASGSVTNVPAQDTSWVQTLINAVGTFLGVGGPPPPDQTNPTDLGSSANPTPNEDSNQISLIPTDPTSMSSSTVQGHQNTYLANALSYLTTATSALGTKLSTLTSSIAGSGGTCSLATSVYGQTVSINFCAVDMGQFATIIMAVAAVCACLLLVGV